MALREYSDGDGVSWKVWAVRPSAPPGAASAYLPGELSTGWLCFDCGSEKRRLIPVPRDWEARSDADLDVLRRAAEVVKRV